MLKYCLLANLGTTTLLLSLVSFFTTVEHNMLRTTQAEIHPTVEEIIKEENSFKKEFVDSSVAIKNKQFITTEDLLIINLTGQPIPINNQELLFTGIVHPFNEEELDRKYNIVWEQEIKQKLAKKYSDKAILVLNSVSSLSKETN